MIFSQSFPTIPQTTEAWHSLTTEQVLQLLQTDSNRGLTEEQISQRQQYFGSNELKETNGRSSLVILWEQFTNIMLVMLIVVAIVSAL